MSASKALRKAVHKYVRKNSNHMELSLSKGERKIIRAAAAEQGQSVNEYITQAIAERMERDAAGQPNAETIAAMEEIEQMIANGGGEHFSGSTEDFFRQFEAE